MATTTVQLEKYLAQLDTNWKWRFPFTPPAQLEPEWQSWVAASERAEQIDTLTYWSRRGQPAV